MKPEGITTSHNVYKARRALVAGLLGGVALGAGGTVAAYEVHDYWMTTDPRESACTITVDRGETAFSVASRISSNMRDRVGRKMDANDVLDRLHDNNPGVDLSHVGAWQQLAADRQTCLAADAAHIQVGELTPIALQPTTSGEPH